MAITGYAEWHQWVEVITLCILIQCKGIGGKGTGKEMVGGFKYLTAPTFFKITLLGFGCMCVFMFIYWRKQTQRISIWGHMANMWQNQLESRSAWSHLFPLNFVALYMAASFFTIKLFITSHLLPDKVMATFPHL